MMAAAAFEGLRIATSGMWKITYRACLTTSGVILMSLSGSSQPG